MDEWGWYDHTEPRRERDRDYEAATWERIIADQKRAREREREGAATAGEREAEGDESGR